jgi:hypothetical protein
LKQPYIVEWGCKMAQPLWKEFSIEASYDPATLLWIYTRELKTCTDTSIYTIICSIIHNSPKWLGAWLNGRVIAEQIQNPVPPNKTNK